MKHEITITSVKDHYSTIVKDDTGYGRRVSKTRTLYGYQCTCGKNYDAYDGTTSRQNARDIAREDHQ